MSGSLLFIRVVIRFFSNPSAKSICIPVFSRITFTTSVMGACSKSVPNRPCRPPTSQLFHDISTPEAWPVKNVLASGRKSLQCRVQYILKRLTFFRSFIRHTTGRSRIIIYRHRIFLTLPQKGYATVPHGSSHIGSKLLLRHVIQSFVPYADKQFLHNIFRVVLVRNISIGYTAQP